MSRKFKSINIAVLTISDTRTSLTDKSGTFLSSAVVDAGHNVFSVASPYAMQSFQDEHEMSITDGGYRVQQLTNANGQRPIRFIHSAIAAAHVHNFRLRS